MKTNLIFHLIGVICLFLSVDTQARLSGDDGREEDSQRVTRYVYLMASSNSMGGEHYLYTEVLKVEANTVSGMQFQIHTLMLEFEDVLYERYPDANLMASMKWLGGAFKERNMARLERGYYFQQHGEKATSVLLNPTLASND